jgi:hypothetical protein
VTESAYTQTLRLQRERVRVEDMAPNIRDFPNREAYEQHRAGWEAALRTIDARMAALADEVRQERRVMAESRPCPAPHVQGLPGDGVSVGLRSPVRCCDHGYLSPCHSITWNRGQVADPFGDDRRRAVLAAEGRLYR